VLGAHVISSTLSCLTLVAIPTTGELAQRAALLSAMLEDYEAQWVASQDIVLADYALLVNAQRRVLRTIGLERRPLDVTPGNGLALDKLVEAVRESRP